MPLIVLFFLTLHGVWCVPLAAEVEAADIVRAHRCAHVMQYYNRHKIPARNVAKRITNILTDQCCCLKYDCQCVVHEQQCGDIALRIEKLEELCKLIDDYHENSYGELSHQQKKFAETFNVTTRDFLDKELLVDDHSYDIGRISRVDIKKLIALIRKSIKYQQSALETDEQPIVEEVVSAYDTLTASDCDQVMCEADIERARVCSQRVIASFIRANGVCRKQNLGTLSDTDLHRRLIVELLDGCKCRWVACTCPINEGRRVELESRIALIASVRNAFELYRKKNLNDKNFCGCFDRTLGKFAEATRDTIISRLKLIERKKWALLTDYDAIVATMPPVKRRKIGQVMGDGSIADLVSAEHSSEIIIPAEWRR